MKLLILLLLGTSSLFATPPLATLLSDERSLLENSEFSIAFPEEENPGIQLIVVKARNLTIEVTVKSKN